LTEEILAALGPGERTDLDGELAAAAEAAEEAGRIIRRYFRTGLQVDHKAGDEPVTRADREAQEAILARLSGAFPGYGVLAEEQADTTSWSAARRAWVVDPLDGTKDFIAGRDGFSVMIGLLEAGRPVLGVVHQPAGGRTFAAIQGRGAVMRKDGAPARLLSVSAQTELPRLRLVASKSHRGETIDRARQLLGLTDELNVGSVGLKISLIARDQRDLYINPEGHCKLWDSCAPEIIRAEAGGRMTDLRGDPLAYGPDQLRLHRGILATNGVCHEAVARALTPLWQGAAGAPRA